MEFIEVWGQHESWCLGDTALASQFIDLRVYRG